MRWHSTSSDSWQPSPFLSSKNLLPYATRSCIGSDFLQQVWQRDSPKYFPASSLRQKYSLILGAPQCTPLQLEEFNVRRYPTILKSPQRVPNTVNLSETAILSTFMWAHSKSFTVIASWDFFRYDMKTEGCNKKQTQHSGKPCRHCYTKSWGAALGRNYEGKKEVKKMMKNEDIRWDCIAAKHRKTEGVYI